MLNKSFKILMLFFITTSIFGCNSLSKTQPEYQRSTPTLEQDTRQFFNEHPEYLLSKQEETQLYNVFKEIIKKPQNKNKNIYMLLTISHEKIKTIQLFDKDKTVS